MKHTDCIACPTCQEPLRSKFSDVHPGEFWLRCTNKECESDKWKCGGNGTDLGIVYAWVIDERGCQDCGLVAELEQVCNGQWLCRKCASHITPEQIAPKAEALPCMVCNNTKTIFRSTGDPESPLQRIDCPQCVKF